MSILSHLLPALGLYGAAHALRIVRLGVCLGAFRLPARELTALHCVGVALSYRLLPAFFYEAILLGGGTARRRDATAPLLYSLLLLRLFDALILVCLLLLTPPAAGLEELVRPALMLLTGVALLCWFGVAALPPLLLRLEQRFLRSNAASPWVLTRLKATHALRVGLDALSWRRRGTVSLVVVLSALSWGLEWQALAVLAGSAARGAADLLARVGGSMGIRIVAPGGYEVLAPGMYLAAIISAAYALHRLYRSRRSHV